MMRCWMYKGHQGAKQLESYVETALIGEGENQAPSLHISASESGEGVLVTVANLSDTDSAELDCAISGLGKMNQVEGKVLTGACGAYNDFGSEETVKPVPLAAELTGDSFKATLPACSVAAFTVK